MNVQISTVAALACCLALAANSNAQSTDPAEPYLGVWSGVFTTQNDPYWQLEDYVCFPGCPDDVRDFFTSLLDDPANDEVPVDGLLGRAWGYAAEHLASTLTPLGKQIQAANQIENDPKLRCEPYGFVREVTNPLPMEVFRDGDRLVIRYEEWSLLRFIYLDGRERPEFESPSLLGHSIGRVENGELVVETSGINPGWISDFTRGGHSASLTATERYRVLDDPHRLELELTLRDPEILTAPYQIRKTWLSTPDAELVQDRCAELPGTILN